MYHCHLRLYCVGRRQDLFDPLWGVAPPEHFTHTFLESREPDATLAAQAGVIFADLTGLDAAEAVKTLSGGGAELIVLAKRETDLTGLYPLLRDVWVLPMTPEELTFRFQRWERGCQAERELWESRQFLDAAMDSVPNLVWY